MKNVKLDLSLNISVFKQRRNEKKKTITKWILLKIQEHKILRGIMELSKFDMEASFYEMCETNFNYTVTLKFKRARNKTMLSLELGQRCRTMH